MRLTLPGFGNHIRCARRVVAATREEVTADWFGRGMPTTGEVLEDAVGVAKNMTYVCRDHLDGGWHVPASAAIIISDK